MLMSFVGFLGILMTEISQESIFKYSLGIVTVMLSEGQVLVGLSHEPSFHFDVVCESRR